MAHCRSCEGVARERIFGFCSSATTADTFLAEVGEENIFCKNLCVATPDPPA